MTRSDFPIVFREHKASVYGFAWRMTGSASAADDVTQDCLDALLNSADNYDASRGSLRSYLIRMTLAERTL